MPIYLVDAIYHHMVIGLTHIMEGAVVMHIASIAILATVLLTILSVSCDASTAASGVT